MDVQWEIGELNNYVLLNLDSIYFLGILEVKAALPDAWGTDLAEL